MSGSQDTVRCKACGRFCYNAPRVETGLKPRTVRTTHEAIRPALRARIILRANGACEACHRGDGELHVGHWVSVADGHAAGLTDEQINSEDNLLALCAECNLGLGRETIPLRLVLAAVMARAKREVR
jgi:5-methylcytosine-specific restriction endonuclease McrA